MSQSQPQSSFSSALMSSLPIPSILLLAALLVMGLWMVKGTTTPTSKTEGVADPDATLVTSALPTIMPVSVDSIDEPVQWRVANEQDIPFPLYPNATRYRIGGQNGLKLALFETTDEFGEVDHFYAEKATTTGLSRQQMMPDYVQYGEGASAQPATAEDSPGVLIYAFFNAKEAREAGATPSARTSIIISYR